MAASADCSVCGVDSCVDAASEFGAPLSGGAGCGLVAPALLAGALRERSGRVAVENCAKGLVRSRRGVGELVLAEPLASAGGADWPAVDGENPDGWTRD